MYFLMRCGDSGLTEGSRGVSGRRLQERASFLQSRLIRSAGTAKTTSASAGSCRRSAGLADDINRLLPIPVKQVGVGAESEQMLD